MKHLIKLEELGMLLLSIAALSSHHPAWWIYLLLAFGPDISMLGYFFGNKAGAASYNLFHHKGIAIAIYVGGLFYNNETLILSGIILFGHASMDRIFGYGLKYDQGFKFTHLGEIGNK
jgi:hypothetical protein